MRPVAARPVPSWAETNIPYTLTQEDNRYEGKLTGNINSRHSLVASYLDANNTVTGDWFGNIVDLRSLKDRELPNSLLSGHYNGAITNNFFLEGLYTQPKFAFVGDGANALELSETFGQATNHEAHQLARTYRVSVGLRF